MTKKECSFDGCLNEVRARGLCGGHAQQYYKGASLRPLRVKNRWVDGKKACSRCGALKAEVEYPANAAHPTGRASTCKPCNAELQREMKYNLPRGRYAEILAAQGGACAICGVEECPSGNNFSVDHDHGCCPGSKSCGECVRELLCGNCNTGLGKFRDSPDLLSKAIEYLVKHR